MTAASDQLILAVSGRPAFQGGAGELIGLVRQQAEVERLPLRLVCARREYPIMGSLGRGRIDRAVVEPWLRRLDRCRLHRALRRFALCETPLLVFHPQSLGLDRILRAVGRRSRPIWIFVLDCSFFCRRSYNAIPGEWTPCVRCLGNDGHAADAHGCLPPFPRGNGAEQQREFRRLARAGRFRFLVQTKGHARLLAEHLGGQAKAFEVGLEVPGIVGGGAHEEADGFDLVYHAAPTWEKGVGVLRHLAKYLPEFRILAPFAAVEGEPGWPSNVIFRPMTWATGLRDEIAKAKCVLCPSVWSAPIEGAVLKSLAHNGLVALFRGDGQFGLEIPPEAVVALAAGEIERSAATLRAVLRDRAERERRRAAAGVYMDSFRQRSGQIARRICGIIHENDPPRK